MKKDQLVKEVVGKENWAVVGVSENKDRWGYKIWKKLKEHNYNTYGINPKYDELEGEKIYRSLKDIEDPIDVVDLVVGPKVSINVLDEIKALGIEYVFFQPGTYNDQVIKKAEELGIKYIVDNCIYAILVGKENK